MAKKAADKARAAEKATRAAEAKAESAKFLRAR